MNVNGRATGSRGGNVNGRPSPGSPSRTYVPASLKIGASVENATTSPRAIWASANRYLIPDTGLTTTIQFPATRVKLDVAGGRWGKIALIYAGAYFTSLKSPFGTLNTARVTLSAVLELANGTLTSAYTSPNTGGTLFQATFNGSVDGTLLPGDLLVSDWIYPSDLGLTSFNFTDRTLLPWVRTAYSKTSATDVLGAKTTTTEYNYPCNSHTAQCTTYAAGKTLINTTGINSYNSGNNFWGASDSSTIPTVLGIIGEPLDGQKAIIWFHTSLGDGTGGSGFMNGGVDPANNSMYNYDQPSYPCLWAQNLTNSTPILNISVGGSSMFNQWSSDSTNNWAASDAVLSNSRFLMSDLPQWFDYCIAQDVVNDVGGAATYQTTLWEFTRKVRTKNQSLKIYMCYEPNGYSDITGTPVPYGTTQDPLWVQQAAMVTAGYWDGSINMRGDGTKLFLDSGTQVSSTTTALGTTTTLIDSGQNWLRNQWVNSWVSVGGVLRVISANDKTTLTFGAYGAAVTSGTAYLILGNQTNDGLHPNTFAQRTVFPAKLDAELSAAGIYVPRFIRTQS